ncbi:hypothetical protein SCLCIDRAFT_1222394, partial [Scleroderma citrinum Foug A]
MTYLFQWSVAAGHLHTDLSLLCENEKAFYDLPDPTTHFPSAAKFTRVEQNLVFPFVITWPTYPRQVAIIPPVYP